MSQRLIPNRTIHPIACEWVDPSTSHLRSPNSYSYLRLCAIAEEKGKMFAHPNTIIVMTSNIGSEHILNVAVDDADYEKMHKRVTQALRGHFRPEFLNRIDELIIFHTLKRDKLYQIGCWKILLSKGRSYFSCLNCPSDQ